jgi:hypothetical protein
MHDQQVKIHYDLARPGSEKQVTYIPISAQVAQILDQQLAQGMKVEQVNIISQGGVFCLAIRSACNFPEVKAECVQVLKTKSIAFEVWGTIIGDEPRMIEPFSTPQIADAFKCLCEGYDASLAPRTGKSKKQMDAWTKKRTEWAKNHPAKAACYDTYFVREVGGNTGIPAEQEDQNKFSVFGIYAPDSDDAMANQCRLIRDFPTEEKALAFFNHCKKHNNERPAYPMHGAKAKAEYAVEFSKWRDQHPAKSEDYFAFFIKQIEHKD